MRIVWRIERQLGQLGSWLVFRLLHQLGLLLNSLTYLVCQTPLLRMSSPMEMHRSSTLSSLMVMIVMMRGSGQ